MRRLSRRRTARYDAGEYLIDGPTLLAEAVASGVEILRIYVESSATGVVGEALDLVDGGRLAESTVTRILFDGTLAKVLDIATPNGVVSVARIPEIDLRTPLAECVRRRRPLLVAIDVGDPGNVGTMLRSAEAAGFAGAILAGECADPFAPKVVRSSAGSIFRLSMAVGHQADEVLHGLSHSGINAWATTISGGLAPEEADLSGSCAVVIGNEAHGLSASAVERCPGRISIPMSGSVESLNAAMAATVIAFESARQQRVDGGLNLETSS